MYLPSITHIWLLTYGITLILSSLNEETLCKASFKQTVDPYRLVRRMTRTLLVRSYFDVLFVMKVPVTDHISGLADQAM